MIAVPDWIINLYSWITYLTPIWLLLIAVFWRPLKALYHRYIQEPNEINDSRLDKVDKEIEDLEKMMELRNDALKALLHNEIFQMARSALKRGYTTAYELDALEELYKPYKDVGGNGTAEKFYEDCCKLEVKPITIDELVKRR